VVVLAVDVVRDHSAHGDIAGAGRDGKEPSFRKKYVNNLGKTDAALATQHAGRFIKTEEAVEAPAIDQFAAGVETRVAVAASQAIREQGTGCGGAKQFRHLVVPCRFMNMLVRGLRVTAHERMRVVGELLAVCLRRLVAN